MDLSYVSIALNALAEILQNIAGRHLVYLFTWMSPILLKN